MSWGTRSNTMSAVISRSGGRRRNAALWCAWGVLGCFIFTAAVVADPCEVEDDGSGTVVLPPDGCEYLSPDDVHKIIDGLPPGTTIELGVSHRSFFCATCTGGANDGQRCDDDDDCPGGLCRNVTNPECSFNVLAGCEEPGGTLGGEKECSGSELHLELTGTGDLDGYSRSIVLPVFFETHTAPRTPGDPVQSFDTAMFRLTGEITGDPDFDLLRITAGDDYGLPSPGHTTLRAPTGGGTRYWIDSFFDITYRIEYTGAAGGPLDGFTGDSSGSIRMATGGTIGACCAPNQSCSCVDSQTRAECDALNGKWYPDESCAAICVDGNCIPATSTWGLGLLVLLVLIAGTMVLRRRQVAMA